MEDIHVYSGLALPIPFLVGALRFVGTGASGRPPAVQPMVERPTGPGCRAVRSGPASAPTALAGDPRRQVQRRAEAQRRLRRRGRPGDARDRGDHALVSPVAAELADRGHLRARLAGSGRRPGRRRPYRHGAAGPGSAARHGGGHHQSMPGPSGTPRPGWTARTASDGTDCTEAPDGKDGDPPQP